MNNLTKHEVLKHRHLSLLKELEKAGVSAKCDANGEWRVGLPSHPLSIGYYTVKLDAAGKIIGAGKCDVCMGEGKIMVADNGAVEMQPCPARNCPFRDDKTVAACAARFDKHENFGGYPSPESRLANDAFVCNYRIAVDTYSENIIYYNDIDKVPVSRVPLTPLLRSLLDALQAAIVAAPAKA